jgi:hypothetical protein
VGALSENTSWRQVLNLLQSKRKVRNQILLETCVQFLFIAPAKAFRTPAGTPSAPPAAEQAQGKAI